MTSRRVEILLLIGVMAASMGALALWSRGGNTVMYDSFRDMAWARTIVSGGEILADPTLAGQTYWYPPGNPVLFAAAAAVTGADVGRVYASSSVWWNALIPVALFLLVRRASDRSTALLSLPFVLLGSLWWMTHIVSAMPSIQAVLLGLVCLLLWQQFLRSGSTVWPWAVACGVVLAATAWVHPVCAIVAAAAIGLHAVAVMIWPALAARELRSVAETRRSFAGALLAVGGLSCALAAPLMVHLLTMARHNIVPMRYLAPELFNPEFAVHLHAPLVVPLAVIGVCVVMRHFRAELWLVAYLTVGVLGSAPAYLERWTGTMLPALLPHEFQWHAQLATGVCAAFGVVAAGRWLTERLRWPSDRRLGRLLCIGGLAVAAISPALVYLEVADSYLVDLRSIESTRGDLVTWIREGTELDEVFACAEQHGYLIVAGLAGRRCVSVPIGFMNPAADRDGRAADLRTMLSTHSEHEFLTIARRRGVGHLLVIVDSEEAAELLGRAVAWPSLVPVFRSSASPAMVFAIDTVNRFG